jgi:hypothetical protein
MGTKKTFSDQEIMSRLREPINELIDTNFPNKNPWERLRIRQLAWQAVDVLARTGNIANLENEKEMQRIARDIRQLGASKEFIEESFKLAVTIYRQMQIEYPGLLKRYQGR